MKFIKYFALLVAFMNIVITASADEKRIKFKDLPETAKSFYNSNFSERRIRSVEYDANDKEYQITLSGGTTITFNKDGEWIEIDCEGNDVVPASVISTLPQDVQNEINSYLKKYSLVEIERNLSMMARYKYKIKIADNKGADEEIEI